ncbi:hypothetical protein [Calothrix sp. UHCC 0171]|uniref:hypothetical protein n=1 Tax=Calothrix sp. UHCC 0171 TaxID=3110245 RepID=UPI002B2201FB|nr:hypothetical protein [Calothrix sp. UHCC 0171]MEA5572378.1 hypothetical protein [Calothrix sp. UHCC 0171]
MKYLSLEIEDLVEIYNYAPQVLLKNATKVSLTEDSLKKLSHNLVTLTAAKNGNYWLIEAQENNYWLFPKENIKIDAFKLETVKYLFQCHDYNSTSSNLITLIKPAKVSLMSNKIEWKLEELGEIKFVNSIPLGDSKLQIEAANQEIIQLQLQLEELIKERNKFQNDLKIVNENFDCRIQSEIQKQNQLIKLMGTYLHSNFHELKTQLTEIKQVLNVENRIMAPTSQTQNTNSHKDENEEVYHGLPHIHWLKEYNRNPASFEQYATQVIITKESIHNRRLGSNQSIFLENTRKGFFWVITDDDTIPTGKLLVPSANLKINEYKLETVQFLFELTGNISDNISDIYIKFTITKPAIVTSVEQGKYQLIETGVINFE